MPRPSKPLSRRKFLKAAGATAAGLALPQVIQRATATAAPSLNIPRTTSKHLPLPMDEEGKLTAGQQGWGYEWDFIQPRPARLDLWGRITHYGTPVREAPSVGEIVALWLPQDHVLPLLEELHVEDSNPYNPNNTLWYRIDGGYLYTADVQPMKPYKMPQEVADITTEIDEEPGFWAEVIVPYTQARSRPGGTLALTNDEENPSLITHTYSSVHRVIDVEPDGGGYLWYKVADDKKGEGPVWILARHMRMIAPDDLTPINPGADKRIAISLLDQRLDCYEGNQIVYSTLISSGSGGYATPKGEHAVIYKQPSRHMYSDAEEETATDPDFFDLPGVPFNTFFTTMGHAIHGTYWHGDYGRTRSHGCVNVSPEAARWLYRWTEPTAPYSSLATGSAAEPGTPVIVT